MPVYEAISDEDYAKIVNFLNALPPDSIWNKCFRGIIVERTVEWIKFWKEQKPYWHIFYVEDEKGKFKALGSLEERGLNPNEPKIVTNVMVVMDETDIAKNYGDVFELLKYMAKWCVEREIFVAEFVIRDVDLPFMHKASTTVTRELGERSGHKLYLCRVELNKFLVVQ